MNTSIEMRGPSYNKKSTEEIKSRIRKDFGVEVNLNISSFKEAAFPTTFTRAKSPFKTIPSQKSEQNLLKDKSSLRLMSESKNNSSISR